MQLLKYFKFQLLSAAALTLWSFYASASIDTAASLRARYQSLLPTLESNVFDAPLYIESEDSQGRVRGEVFGVVYHRIEDLRAMVTSPAEWCALLVIHPNIKYCTHQAPANGEIALTIYAGKKQFLPIEETRRNEYRVRVNDSPGYLTAHISAQSGPIDTSDYRLILEAIPIDHETTFVHVGFSYRYGSLTRALSATYFGTIGRNKVGFSVIGRDKQGEPIFVRGRVASLERTVMRTYLALQTWLEGRSKPESDRFDWRLRRWYFLTERYPKQLYEFEEKEYLDVKHRERASQSLPARTDAAPLPQG
jgi:hypothetical protein